MDQFVSTYRHDFLWPYIRSLGKRLIESELPHSEHEKKCRCCITRDLTDNQEKPVDVLNIETENKDWNRLGPMGRLLEPKLYPVKVGSSPETDTMRDDQPNMFLNKLQKKFPFMYEVLKEAPALEYAEKVNKDRLKTTYQLDFCQSDFIPEHIIRAGRDPGLAPCAEPKHLPPDAYEAFQKMKARRPGHISKLGQFKKKRKSNEDAVELGPWSFTKTEYQDKFGKVVKLIMRCR